MDLTQLTVEELYEVMANSLMRCVPSSWQQIEMLFEFENVGVTSKEASYDDISGEQDIPFSLKLARPHLSDSFLELDKRMQEAGHGKWQRALLSLGREGQFNLKFIYPDQMPDDVKYHRIDDFRYI